jgi:hypothetical protein
VCCPWVCCPWLAPRTRPSGPSRRRRRRRPGAAPPSRCSPLRAPLRLVFPEVRSPCSTGFWFPKSLEYWLRLSLVYCNTKDNPLQTSGFPIKVICTRLYSPTVFMSFRIREHDCWLAYLTLLSSAAVPRSRRRGKGREGGRGRGGAGAKISKNIEKSKQREGGTDREREGAGV